MRGAVPRAAQPRAYYRPSDEASGAAHTSFAFFVGVTVLLAVRECVDVGVPDFVFEAVFVLVRVL